MSDGVVLAIHGSMISRNFTGIYFSNPHFLESTDTDSLPTSPSRYYHNEYADSQGQNLELSYVMLCHIFAYIDTLVGGYTIGKWQLMYRGGVSRYSIAQELNEASRVVPRPGQRELLEIM